MTDPRLILAAIPFLALLSAYVSADHAGPAEPSLGAASRYAVLAGTTVTNTDTTKITGDVGVSSPSGSVIGFPPGRIERGALHVGDPSATRAQRDVRSAYNVLARKKCRVSLAGLNLGAKTLRPGVYCFTSAARLTGQLVLDASNKVNATWVFQIAGPLTTAPNSSVVMAHGGRTSNVFWQVAGAAALDTGTAFAGNLLTASSIAMSINTSVSGRALARGAVTVVRGNVSTVMVVVPQ